MLSLRFFRRLVCLIGPAGPALACGALVLAGCENSPSAPRSAGDPTVLGGALDPGGRDSSGVYGELAISPDDAPPGTPRMIHLSLVNPTGDTLRLVFPSAQIYDFLLVYPPSGPGPGDHGQGDPGWGDHGHHGHGHGPGRNGCGHEWSDSTDVPPPHPGGEVPPPDLIWNWAYGRIFPDVVTEIVLGPGEVKSYEESWNGLSNEGTTVGPGAYTMLARIPSDTFVPVVPVRVLVREP